MTRLASKPTLQTILDRRRQAGGISRDLTDGSVSGRGAFDDEKPFASPMGWLLGILAAIVAIIGTVIAIVTLPPIFECRNRAEEGFFVGQTYGSCVSAGTSARWNLLEARVKMTLLRSGR